MGLYWSIWQIGHQMIIGFNDELLECVSTKLRQEQDKYFDAMFEDRDEDANKHNMRIKHLKKLIRNGEEFIPKF